MNAEDIPRYAEPTWQEYAEMAKDAERTPADVMHECDHQAACLRVMGMLCFGDGGYSGAVTTPEEDERAARWMGCDACEHWEGRTAGDRK